MSRFSVIYFCMLLLQLTCVCKKFDNYTIYEVSAFNSRERALLYFLYLRNELLVFMNGVTNEAAVSMDVIVDASCTSLFENKMKDNDIEYVKIQNEKLVKNKEDLIIKKPSYPYAHLPNLTTEFHSWETLLVWVEFKLKKFQILKKIRIAYTYEKREVFALKISSGKRKSAIFLMGGEDGRDWLSPAILLHFVDYILEHKHNVDLLTKHYDFYIVPLMNPDGYDYSMMKDLYWTRNRNLYFPKRMCPKSTPAIGINLYRNWYFSNDIKRDEECEPVYSGSKSLSEDETKGVARFLDRIALQMLAFINVRGFQHLVTIPYANDDYCNNYPVLLDIISSVHDRVKQEHRKSFFYGTTASYFYNHSGNVADWVKKKLNTPIVYTFYMNSDNYIFPSPSDVQPQTHQFSTMMKEILLLGSSVYSPLFSQQIRHIIQTIVIIVNIILTWIL